MTDLTREEGIRIVKLMLAGMIALLFVVAYVFYTDYQGRKSEVAAVRSGCERDKRDRAANAEGWRIAEAARRAEGMNDVANRYQRIASGMEERAKINCNKIYPSASFFP
jgi:hypothetical protein